MVLRKINKLFPLLKYPGGKGRELCEILPNLPANSKNYYEPFVGGGAVFFALNANEYFINDKSIELMNLYDMVAKQNKTFFEKLQRINYDWILMSKLVENHFEELADIYYNYRENAYDDEDLKVVIISFVKKYSNEFNGLLLPDFTIDTDNFISEIFRNIKNKFQRMKKMEAKKGTITRSHWKLNFEAAFKSAFYMHFRYLYNNIKKFKIEKPFATAIYVFIREYCYSSMFRYNLNGEFNVPYGGISYNKKELTEKIKYFKSLDLINRLKETEKEILDFEVFLEKHPPKNNDFIFIDPPYDTEFSTYAQNEFGRNDQERLASYLKEKCDAYFMIIIKDTNFIRNLYPNNEVIRNNRLLNVRIFDKQYSVSFQDRNDKDVKHLLITNY